MRFVHEGTADAGELAVNDAGNHLKAPGVILVEQLHRRFAADHGFGLFGVYCWGLALFIFILNLVV